MENENITTEQEVQEENQVVEFNQIDYSQQFETIIELQTQQNNLIAQNNVNQLFVIGCMTAVFVCVLLYNAIKKFI